MLNSRTGEHWSGLAESFRDPTLSLLSVSFNPVCHLAAFLALTLATSPNDSQKEKLCSGHLCHVEKEKLLSAPPFDMLD